MDAKLLRGDIKDREILAKTDDETRFLLKAGLGEQISRVEGFSLN